MGIREEQVALTRERIVATFLDLGSTVDAEPVTMAEVARASGISPATVYRHFPNRQELVTAAAHRDATLGIERADGRYTLDDLRDHLGALWARLAANLPVTREAAISAAGRELRQSRFESAAGLFRRTLTDEGVDTDAPDGQRLLSALALLMSVHTFLDLHDRHGLSVDDAVDTATWAIEQLLRGQGLDPSTLVFIDETEGPFGSGQNGDRS